MLTSHHNELEKHFAKEGIYLYDLRENTESIVNHKNDKKLEFKIRENKKIIILKKKIK